MKVEKRIVPAPVVKQVRVAASPARAFEVFAPKMGRWWPKNHHIGEAELADVVVEPRAGGRFYERGEDGAECEWGRVLDYVPGQRLLLAWQLNAEWVYDPEFEVEVEVTFVADGDHTLVTLEHRNLERYGARAEEIAQSIGSPTGWQAILAEFAALIEKST